MSTAEFVRDLIRLGIRLEACGDRLRFYPKSLVTPHILSRLAAGKTDILALLRAESESGPDDPTHTELVPGTEHGPPCGESSFQELVVSVFQCTAASCSDGDQPFAPSDDPHRHADGSEQWPGDSIDPSELAPCQKCGRLEQWESASTDPRGLLPGKWRCLACDPPSSSLRLMVASKVIRERAERMKKTKRDGGYLR